MPIYKFSEGEVAHGKRLRNFRHTRMLRRALLHKYNGVDYKEHIPQYILEMSREELMRDAGVSLEGNTFVPSSVFQLAQAREALAQHAFWTNNQLPGEKSAIRIQRGDAPGVLPYPYRYCRESDHRLTLDTDIRSLIHHAFEGLLSGERVIHNCCRLLQ